MFPSLWMNTERARIPDYRSFFCRPPVCSVARVQVHDRCARNRRANRPRVDYELTDLGRKLIVPLQSPYDWAVANRPAMLAARLEFMRRTQKGDLLQSDLVAEI